MRVLTGLTYLFFTWNIPCRGARPLSWLGRAPDLRASPGYGTDEPKAASRLSWDVASDGHNSIWDGNINCKEGYGWRRKAFSHQLSTTSLLNVSTGREAVVRVLTVLLFFV